MFLTKLLDKHFPSYMLLFQLLFIVHDNISSLFLGLCYLTMIHPFCAHYPMKEDSKEHRPPFFLDREESISEDSPDGGTPPPSSQQGVKAAEEVK